MSRPCFHPSYDTIVTNIHQLAEQYTEDNTSIPYQPTRGTPSGEKGTVMAGYPEYYQRAIDAYEHGIKLVLGPTGLGKSSSIPDVVHSNPDRKFIYMANRKQLLEEMAAQFKPGDIVCRNTFPRLANNFSLY